MAQVQNFLKSFEVMEEDITSLANDLNVGVGLKLSELVGQLGPALTHRDVDKRQAGLEFLSKTLAQLQKDKINREESSFLTEFYVDRLKDTPLMHSGIVGGFHALVLNHGQVLVDVVFLKIITGILDEMNTQVLTVGDRTKVFEILSWSLENKLDVVKAPKFSSQFVLGFLQAVEGETNPRNLVIVFSCWPVVLRELDVSIYAVDIFETLSCYFPVDFTPPKNSNVKVTKEDLTKGLRNCIHSYPKFAEWAIPLFLEKFSSDLQESKLESLLYFRYCLEKYSPHQLKPHLKDIWTQCKQEIMGVRSTKPDRDVVENSFALLKAVTKKLGSSLQTAENSAILLNWIEITWSELKPFLKFLETNLVEIAVEILACLCSADDHICEPLLNESIAVLINVHQTAAEKIRIHEMMCKILEAGFPLKAIPDWTQDFIKICETDAMSSNMVLRHISHVTVAKATLKVPCSSITIALVNFFNRTTVDFNYINMSTMKELAKSLSVKKPDLLIAWCGSLLHHNESKNLQYLPLFVFACVINETVLQRVFPELLTLWTQGILDENLFGLKAVNQIVDGISSHASMETYVPDILNHLEVLNTSEEATALKNETLCLIFRSFSDESYTANFDKVLNSFLLDKNETSLLMAICSAHPSLLLKSQALSRLFAADLDMITEEIMIARASVCNKLYPNQVIKDYLLSILTSNVPFLNWIVKGLLMGGAKEGSALLDQFLSQWKQSEKRLPESVLSITEESEFLSQKNHHRYLAFFKQKFFMQTNKTLMEWYELEKDDKFLDLILLQLPNLPKPVLQSEVLPLAPKFISILFKPGTQKLSKASRCFLEFIQELDDELLLGMSETAVPFLLNLALNVDCDMNDRITSLNLLDTLASEKCPRDLKSMVSKRTLPLLNDKKRLIRKAAVEARNAWMIL